MPGLIGGVPHMMIRTDFLHAQGAAGTQDPVQDDVLSRDADAITAV
jgi:hypothetical protein